MGTFAAHLEDGATLVMLVKSVQPEQVRAAAKECVHPTGAAGVRDLDLHVGVCHVRQRVPMHSWNVSAMRRKFQNIPPPAPARSGSSARRSCLRRSGTP